MNSFLTQLSAASKPQQRNMLGEMLYPRIAAREQTLAGKITGMLLELDTSELLNMLEDGAVLAGKVDEAVSVLRQVGFGKPGQAPQGK